MRLSKRLIGLLSCFLSLISLSVGAEEISRPDFVAANYNVENFLLDSNSYRFWYKAEAVAKVIVDMNGWNHPAMVGLEEIENDSCMRVLSRKLHHLHYDYLHYDSPDRRGIDVALLYDRTRVQMLSGRAISVDLDGTTTRDILYASCVLRESGDTLHVLVCHLPSRLGGGSETEWKREKAYAVVQNTIDSIFAISPNSNVIIMGDMNSSPRNNLRGVVNMAVGKKEGTHKYHGLWTWLDQIYVSEKLSNRATLDVYRPDWLLEEDEKYGGMKPCRCNISHYHWQRGYSDHLPVYLKVKYF